MVGKSLQHMCVARLAEHLASMPHLVKQLAPSHKELLLEHCVAHDMLTGPRLPHITYNLLCSAMTHLHLFRSEQVTDKFLQLFGKCGCQLTALTIDKCINVTDEGIKAVLQGQEELITLQLRRLPQFHGQGLSVVKSPHLETLDLKRCMVLTSEGLEALIPKNTSIKYLILNGCFRLSTSIFSYITKYLSRLEHLDLSDVHCTNDESLLMVADGCPDLCKLEIYGCNKVSDATLTKVFTKCNKLQELDLSYCSNLQDNPDSTCLKTLPQSLSNLMLTGIQLESSSILLNSLSRLTLLTQLHMCGVPAVNDHSLPKILKVIGPQLTHLHLSVAPRAQYELTDLGLEAITDYCSNLEVLLLSSPTGKYTGLPLIPMIENPVRSRLIREIGVSSRMICSELMEAISENCSNLEFLDVAGLPHVMTDNILHNLASSCKSLHSLYAKGCVQMTDDGVCALARCCPLKVISLSGNRQITDKSIFTIANSCPYLEEIYLNGCYYVSPAVVAYLTDTCIPRVYIYHKLPNASPGLLMAKNLDTGEFCRADLMDS